LKPTTLPYLAKCLRAFRLLDPNAPRRMKSLVLRFVELSVLVMRRRTRQTSSKGGCYFDIYVVDMYKWLLIPPDSDKIEDVHYTNDKLEEIMTGYKENQSQAARMFSERKQGMMETKGSYSAGDENSKFYNKPDEAPISHPAEVLERLKKETPDTPMEELVKEADAIVAEEIAERQRKRDAEAASTDGKLEEVKEEGEPEVSSA